MPEPESWLHSLSKKGRKNCPGLVLNDRFYSTQTASFPGPLTKKLREACASLPNVSDIERVSVRSMLPRQDSILYPAYLFYPVPRPKLQYVFPWCSPPFRT